MQSSRKLRRSSSKRSTPPPNRATPQERR
jgi:hypothetical protein